MNPEIYLLIGILIVVIVLVVIILKQKNVLQAVIQTQLEKENQDSRHQMYQQNESMIDRFDKRVNDLVDRNRASERESQKTFTDFQNNLSRNLNDSFDRQHKLIETRLNKIDQKVNESLSEGFDKTQKTFTNIVERLSKIDEAQKKIESLSTDIGDLQSVLTDKSARGAFGEVNLNQILKSVFGEKNDNLYRIQHTFLTGSRADAVLFTPQPLGTVAIDAKFPLENYQKMMAVAPSSLE